MSIETIKQFVKAGFRVFPVNDPRGDYKPKAPKNGWKWQHNTIDHWDDTRLVINDHFGWPVPKGLVVIDVDKPEDFPYYDEMAGHPGQRSIKGNHYVFTEQWNDSLPAQERFPWGEIRRHGTYMVVYQPNDEWLRGEFEPLPEILSRGARLGGSGSGQKASQTSKLEVPPDLTAPVEEGKRNNQLFSYLCQKREFGADDEEINTLAWGKNSTYRPPLDADEVETIIQQVLKYDRGGQQEPPEPTGEFLHAPALHKMEIPPVEFWEGPFGPGQNVLLYGPAGSGKSLYMLDKVSSLDKKICIVDGEMTLALLKQRIGTKPPDNIWFHHGTQPNEFLETDYSQFDMVVLDTLAANYETKYSENDMEHWKTLNHWLTKQATEGFCTLGVHHQGKDKTQGARGSSELNRVFDTTISINDYDDVYAVQQMKDRHCLNLGRTDYEIDRAADGMLRYFRLKG